MTSNNQQRQRIWTDEDVICLLNDENTLQFGTTQVASIVNDWFHDSEWTDDDVVSYLNEMNERACGGSRTPPYASRFDGVIYLANFDRERFEPAWYPYGHTF